MRTKFYIHIGVHKTGTKSIQHTFSQNRDKLLAHGINYLAGDPNHGPNLISLLADHPHADTRNIRKHLDTPEKAASYNASTRYEVTKALKRNRSPKLVISGEGLSSLSDTEIDRLKQMLEPYAASFRIIVYVRDPYEYANSASLQRIKSDTFPKASDKKISLPGYQRRLSRYIRAFGRENIDIRVFDPPRFVGGDLISDFLTAIGESPQLAKNLSVVRTNQSMSHEAAMILSETNRAIPTYVDGRANRARAFGFHMYVVDIKGEKFAMDPDTYLAHEAENLADIEWLNQMMGEPVFGKATPRPASVPRWSEETAHSILDVVGEMAFRIQQLRQPYRGPIRKGLKKFFQRSIPNAFFRRSNNSSGKMPELSLKQRMAKLDCDVSADIPIPAGLEWLQDAIRQPSIQSPPAAVPHFDQAMIRSLGCFLHATALTIQHLEADRSARDGKFLIWISRRKAEDHYRDVVRNNPANAMAQYKLSQAHLLRGHFVEAYKTAEDAVQLAPDRALFRRWLKLIKAAEGRLFTMPEPTAPMQLRSRHARPAHTEERARERAKRQAARAEARSKAGQAASRRPPQ